MIKRVSYCKFLAMSLVLTLVACESPQSQSQLSEDEVVALLLNKTVLWEAGDKQMSKCAIEMKKVVFERFGDQKPKHVPVDVAISGPGVCKDYWGKVVNVREVESQSSRFLLTQNDFSEWKFSILR